MRIDKLEARALTIPFKSTFRHAAAERATTQALWVSASGDGFVGYGEGCPREYVTGESLRTAAGFVSQFADEWRSAIRDLQTLHSWAAAHEDAIGRNPAAWCAVELALLDLIGKSEAKSVESLLGLASLKGRFAYSAVIGDAPPAQFSAQLAKYLQAGFRDFKIKLNADEARNHEKVRALVDARLTGAQVRADANNVWPSADSAIHALEALDFPFWALEEPLEPRDYAGMQRVASALGTRIVLDESAVGVQDLDHIENPRQWIVNLRVSKMGGILRSFDVVSAARERGIDLIVGAQVGETSLLTRAALAVASAAKDRVIAQEGAFGTHLLQHDVIDPPLMFGAAGVLELAPAAFDRPGWGCACALGSTDSQPLPQA
jgi:L-alanine-DL-glutamate epimerase-like enolase superfamily enzyme